MRTPHPMSPLALAILPMFAAAASGSEEEIVLWRSIRLDCGEVPEAGKVAISAERDGDRFRSCEVSAFGKSYKLSAKELERLRGFPLNELSVTHEAGYPRLGGHTVHFKLRRVVYLPKENRSVVDRAHVSISEGKGLVVEGPVRQE